MKLGLTFYLNIITISFALLLVFGTGLFLLGYDPIKGVIAQETTKDEDTTPPKLFNIDISDVSATSSVINWETDEVSDSLINYGLDKNYGILREPRFDKTKHSLVMEELLPDTDYYFRITSSDAKGNQGISSDFSFRTKKIEEEKKTGYAEEVNKNGNGGVTEDMVKEGKAGKEKVETEKQVSLNEVLQYIEQISKDTNGKNVPTSDTTGQNQSTGTTGNNTSGQSESNGAGQESASGAAGENGTSGSTAAGTSEQSQSSSAEQILEQIQEQLQNKAQEVVKPPTIILDNANVEVGTDYAIVSWETDKESNTIVALAKDKEYDAEAANPYTWKEGEPDEKVVQHRVDITGLSPATVYHFQVSSQDALGLKGISKDNTFKTKSIKPEIYNLQVYKIEEESATIRWSTNVPCSSVIEYTNLNNNETKLEGSSAFMTVHSIRLSNLVFDTYYSAVIKVESEDGEKAESDPVAFITTKDEYAPLISKVNTESTLYPGADNKIQTIASWVTDEPAKCQLFYHQGLVTVDEPLSLPLEDDFATKHVQVVTNFVPSTVYKFWIICQDPAGNQAKSDDFTMLTPTQEESIIDIILKNFESSFGWVKKMKVGG